MYNYSPDALFGLLHARAPALANDLANNYRKVHNGLLTVGLKLHCTGPIDDYEMLIRGLGVEKSGINYNAYRLKSAIFCLVLPPVGSAEYAIKLVECLELFTGSKIFDNPQVQIQVCTPGRLSPSKAALLGIAFYLASENLRRFNVQEMATTFEQSDFYPRGKRLVLWDAEGTFDKQFPYWERIATTRFVKNELPFENRTDILTGLGKCTRNDIRNINLFASLLVHSEYKGFWEKYGFDFEQRMLKLLEEHQLLGITTAPWIHDETAATADDGQFLNALSELQEYAHSEARRTEGKPELWSRWTTPPDKRTSILVDMQSILATTREIIQQRVNSFEGGEWR